MYYLTYFSDNKILIHHRKQSRIQNFNEIGFWEVH